MRTKRPPRLAGFDYAGAHRYFLTVSTDNKRPAFRDLDAGRLIATKFLQYAETHGFAVIAYCFMPDHVHALVKGIREDAGFKLFVRLWKQKTGFEWKQRTGHRLWQEGYYDRVLRPEESDLFVVAYIAGNPVAAGFAETPDAYPLFRSFVYSLEEIRQALAEVGFGVPWKDPSDRERRAGL